MSKIGKAMSLVLYLFILGLNVSAREVAVELVNNHPVKGEQFSVRFKIKLEGNEETYISFDPVGVEVLGRRNEGLSIQTSYINGRIQTVREKIVAYDLIANEAGEAWLKNITVEAGGETISHPKVRMKIYTFARKDREVFVQAEIGKDQLFVGEGFDVKYYIYNRIPVIASEIKKFPVFNGFLKRDFLKEKYHGQVNYGGRIYEKVLVYSVRLYPEKPGSLTIDPINLNIVYENRSAGFPFGSSPFFGGQRYSKSLVSEKLKVNVLPLPALNLPGNFTGLVGEHDFSISINKRKFLVNEAIEVKFEARGPGALEKLELPLLYDHGELEEFNSTSDLNIGATPPFKKIDYTYLGRSQFSIPEREMKLFYFDPEVKEYKSKTIKVPGIFIAGGNYATSGGGMVQPEASEGNVGQPPASTNNIIAPIFAESISGFSYVNWKRIIVYFLLLVNILLVSEFLLGTLVRIGRKKSEAEILYGKIRKSGLSYSNLYTLLLLLFKDRKVLDLDEELARSELPEECKNYFRTLLKTLEKGKFGSGSKSKYSVKLNRSKFNTLLKLINENNKVTSGN